MPAYQMLDEHDAARDVFMRAARPLTDQYVVVKIGPEPGSVNSIMHVTDVPYGILQTTAAKAGDVVRVRPLSSGARSLVNAGAPFVAGEILTIADFGAIGTVPGQVSSAEPNRYPIGLALETASDVGDHVSVQLSATLVKM